MRDPRSKIVTLDQLSEALAPLRAEGKKIVHCHGVFDLVHLGHINYFEQSKRLGDVLYVTLVPDRLIRKGPDRPRFKEQDRLYWVASLEVVDYVHLLDEEGAWSVMRAIRPDVYTKSESDRVKLTDPTHGLSEDVRIIESVGGRFEFINEEIPIHSTDIFNGTWQR